MLAEIDGLTAATRELERVVAVSRSHEGLGVRATV